MADNYRDSNGTYLLSTLNLKLSLSVFVPLHIVCVCVCVWVCVTGGRPVGGKMQEVCLSVSTCIRRSMFFPFRGEVSCMCVLVCVCACVCMYVADHTGRLTSRNPCSKNRHCVFPALTHHYHRTQTHTHTRIIALFSFPLQVSSTPILVPPAVKMFRSDCHERTCSLGPNQRIQIGEEWRHPRSAAGSFWPRSVAHFEWLHFFCTYSSLSCVPFRGHFFFSSSAHFIMYSVSFSFSPYLLAQYSFPFHFSPCLRISIQKPCHPSCSSFPLSEGDKKNKPRKFK